MGLLLLLRTSEHTMANLRTTKEASRFLEMLQRTFLSIPPFLGSSLDGALQTWSADPTSPQRNSISYA